MINGLSWLNLGNGNIANARNTTTTLSSDYNDLTNKPIITLNGTTQEPIKLWTLETGIYILNGYVQHTDEFMSEAKGLFTTITAMLINGNYTVSAYIPFWEGLYEYILPNSSSTEYSQHQVINIMTQETSLILTNETEYTPTNDYHPSTKKYADDMLEVLRRELSNIGVNKDDVNALRQANRRRDIIIQALLNQNSDKMVTINEETHNISLDLAIDNGIATINSLEGSTLVNVSKQKDEVALSCKVETVENTNNVDLVENGTIKPIIQGNTLVNNNAQWDDTVVIGNQIEKLSGVNVNVEETKGEIDVSLEGHTAVNVSNRKGGAIATEFDSLNGNYMTLNPTEDCSTTLEIEGSTLVNVCDQKESVAITKNYTVENTNHVPLQGEYDGHCRPVIYGNTLYCNNDTGELTDTFVEGANLSLVSNFEDQLVTQDMIDSGQEDAKNLGKYKVEYKVVGKNKFDGELVIGRILDTTGEYSSDMFSRCVTANYLRINPNANYTVNLVSTDGNYGINRVFYYDCNKNYLSNKGIDKNGVYNITTPQDSYYIKIGFWNGIYGNNTNITNDDLIYIASNFQLEEGSVATEYEPCKEYTKTFYLNSPLLEGDTIEDVNGKATHVHRYEKLQTEEFDNPYWTSDALTNNGVKLYKLRYTARYVSTLNDITTVIAEKGKVVTNSNECTTINCVYVTTDGNIWWSIGVDDEYSYAEIKTQIGEVYCKLATPTYETISDENILCESYVNGHLDVDTNIPIEKVEFKHFVKDLKYLYPNTNYIIQFESDNIGKLDRVSLGGYVLKTDIPVIKGTNTIEVTTKETLYQSTNLYGIGFNASNIQVVATDKEFDYFEGLSSSYECCYPGGKNLFDEKWRLGFIGDTTGVESSGDGYAITDFISLKPNSTYTFQGYCPRIYMYDNQYNYLGFQQPGGGTLTYQTYKFTTDDKWKYMRLRYVFNSTSKVADLQALIESKCQLEEGEIATEYEPFIDKYKVDVKVTGKNLFNQSTANQGYTFNVKGVYEGQTVKTAVGSDNENKLWVSDYIQVRKGQTFTIPSGLDSAETNGIGFFDYNKEYIIGLPSSTALGTPFTFISPIDGYMRATLFSNYPLQIEEGSVATEYEPCKEYTKTFYLNSPLLEGDKIVTYKGNICHYHKMGKIVLDGSDDERWGLGATSLSENYIRFQSVITNPYANGNHCYSDNFKYFSKESYDNGGDMLWVHSNASPNLQVQISKFKLSTQDTNGFKQWLQNNPTTVVYELAQPYYEPIVPYDDTSVNLFANKSHISTISSVPINSTSFKKYEDELAYLEVNTQYRLAFDCDVEGSVITISLGGTVIEYTTALENSILITTPTELVDTMLTIEGKGYVYIDNVRITKGDTIYPYFKGMKSSFENEDNTVISTINYCPIEFGKGGRIE